MSVSDAHRGGRLVRLIFVQDHRRVGRVFESRIDSTKSATKATDKVPVAIVDAQSGRVM
jgi:hypothetical protein